MEPTDMRESGGALPLVFCCSGASDVAEIGHQAARLLDDRGQAGRFCLAGVSAGVEAHLRKTRRAPSILVIDGCRTRCAQKALARAGFARTRGVVVDALGLPKGQSSPSPTNVARVADAAAQLLTDTAK